MEAILSLSAQDINRQGISYPLNAFVPSSLLTNGIPSIPQQPIKKMSKEKRREPRKKLTKEPEVGPRENWKYSFLPH